MSDETLESLLDDDVEITVDEPVEELETEPEDTEEETETESTVEEGSPTEPEEETGKQEEGEQPLTEREKAFLAKANDEKAKRQALESQQQKPEEVPDPELEPEAYAKYSEAKNANDLFATRLTMSQELMRTTREDYDSKEDLFIELSKDNPVLIQQLRNSPNPAKFAYEYAQKHERMSQFDSFESAVKSEAGKQIEAAKAELEKKLRAEYDAKLKKAESLPPSGAGSSLGSDSTVAGDESLSDILGNKHS